MHILLPDAGKIEVLGSRDTAAARDRVSYLPEERGLYKKMTIRRLLRYYGAAEGPHDAAARPGDRRLDDADGAAGAARSADRDALEGHVAEGAVRRGRRLEAVAADPGRAVLRARPGQRAGPEGRGARDAAARHDGRLQHARHGDRRKDVRSHLHDLPRPQGARRHAREHPGAVRRGYRAESARRPAPSRSTACRRSSPSTISARCRKSGSREIRRRSSRASLHARPSITSRSRVRRCRTSSCGSRNR